MKTFNDEFTQIFNREPEITASAPGRINLIGEHTDYSLGYVLPAAINREIFFQAARRQDNQVVIRSENFDESVTLSLDRLEYSQQQKWSNYVKGILWVCRRRGLTTGGFDGLIRGNVPLGSGLSSSAALEIAVLTGLNRLFEFNLPPLDIAQLGQEAENEFVGVKCGLMDQFIAVFGRKNSAVFLDCLSLKHEVIPFQPEGQGFRVLVYDSRVKRGLADSSYNQRREESSSAWDFIKAHGFENFRSVDPSWLQTQRDELGDLVYRRARHIVNENIRVKKAVSFLKAHRLDKLGELLSESHLSLRDDYEVSCPELDMFFRYAGNFKGCLGGRMIGAGFGGSGIALVKLDKISEFCNGVREEAKHHDFPVPQIYEVEIGEGARIHEGSL